MSPTKFGGPVSPAQAAWRVAFPTKLISFVHRVAPQAPCPAKKVYPITLSRLRRPRSWRREGSLVRKVPFAVCNNVRNWERFYFDKKRRSGLIIYNAQVTC